MDGLWRPRLGDGAGRHDRLVVGVARPASLATATRCPCQVTASMLNRELVASPVGSADDLAPLSVWQRLLCWTLGSLAASGGTVAIFVKNNGTGAGVLLVVGFAFLLMAVMDRRI